MPSKKREKPFRPPFIHVITSISISRRISNSRPVCTYSLLYTSVVRMCLCGLTGCVSCNTKGSVCTCTFVRARIRMAARACVYVRVLAIACARVYHVHKSAYPVPRRNTLATLPRGQTAAVETVCPANWFSLVSSIRRNRFVQRTAPSNVWRQAFASERASARPRPRWRIQSNAAVWLSDQVAPRPIVNQPQKSGSRNYMVHRRSDWSIRHRVVSVASVPDGVWILQIKIEHARCRSSQRGKCQARRIREEETKWEVSNGLWEIFRTRIRENLENFFCASWVNVRWIKYALR